MAASDDRFRHHVRRGEEIALDDLTKHVKDAIVDPGLHDADPEMVADTISAWSAGWPGPSCRGRRGPRRRQSPTPPWPSVWGGLLAEQRCR